MLIEMPWRFGRSVKSESVNWVDSKGRGNIFRLEVLYGATEWLDHEAYGAAADAVARATKRPSA